MLEGRRRGIDLSAIGRIPSNYTARGGETAKDIGINRNIAYCETFVGEKEKSLCHTSRAQVRIRREFPMLKVVRARHRLLDTH